MALSLEPPSFPEPNLVLKTNPIGVEEEVLLFPQFLLITFFLNGKFKHLLSRLYQSTLGQSYDVRCLSSPTDHPVFSDSAALLALAVGGWPPRLCGGGVSQRQSWTSFILRRKRQRYWP